jgi:hypothetical protein
MVRPIFLPSMTRPAMTKGRPSRRSARSMSPAASASRTAELDTRRPPKSTVGMASTTKRWSLPGLLQHGEIPAARLAEAEVVADDQVPHREAADQDLLDELFGGQARQLAIEAADMDAIDAAFRQQLELVAHAGKARRRLVRRKQFARMRLEGQHGRRQGKRTRLRLQFVEQGTMPEMHAIEVADGQHRGRSWPAREHREKPAWEGEAGKGADYINPAAPAWTWRAADFWRSSAGCP